MIRTLLSVRSGSCASGRGPPGAGTAAAAALASSSMVIGPPNGAADGDPAPRAEVDLQAGERLACRARGGRRAVVGGFRHVVAGRRSIGHRGHCRWCRAFMLPLTVARSTHTPRGYLGPSRPGGRCPVPSARVHHPGTPPLRRRRGADRRRGDPRPPGPRRAERGAAGRRGAPAPRQPRLRRRAVRAGDQLVRRLHHEHRAAVAGARPDGLGARDGRGGRAHDAAGPDPGAAGGRVRGPLGPAQDDVQCGPRAVPADRGDPDLGRAGRPDARGDPRGDVPVERAARAVAGRLHGGRPGPGRPRRGAAGQRDLRGRVQHRLDRRAGDRRSPGRDDRPGCDDRHRRRHVPAVGGRDAARATAAAGGDPQRGDPHPRRHPGGRCVRAPAADAPGVHRPVDDDSK